MSRPWRPGTGCHGSDASSIALCCCQLGSSGSSAIAIAWLALSFALPFGAGGVGCGGSTQMKSCVAGAERCACYGNGTCNAGLRCLSDLCVADRGAAGTKGASGTSGAGGTTGAAGVTGASGATGGGGTLGAAGMGAGGAMSSGGAGGTGGSASAGSGGTSARGGAAGTGTGGTTGSGGSGGSAGAGGTGNTGGAGTGKCGDLIDDMEAGTGFICQGDGRTGYWYTYIDPSGFSSITPPASESPTKPVPVSPMWNSSTRAMHASGADTSYAGIGFLVNAPVIDAPWSTFDASGRTGIDFFMKGTGYLRVLMHTPATVAAQYHGSCTTSVCMGAVSSNFLLSPNVWVEIGLPFSSMTSGTAPFDPALLSAIEFQPSNIGAFDLWIDDVRFY